MQHSDMKKDGTQYLVLCSWKADVMEAEQYWEIVKWGMPAGISSSHGQGWVNQSCLMLRMDNCTFLKILELDKVIAPYL